MESKFVRTLVATSCVLLVSAIQEVRAQTLDVHKPGALQPGVNTSTVDSFVGTHYWYINVEPGTFQVTFVQKGRSGQAALGSKVSAGIAFVGPKIEGNTFTFKEGPTTTVFNGHVAKPAEVVIAVEPPNSPLVRDASNYQLEATGNIRYGADVGEDAIVGKYSAKWNNLGFTKFVADGTVECANGNTGSWKCFDNDTRTYVVTIAGENMSLKLVPALGLLDQANNIRFECIVKGPQ